MKYFAGGNTLAGFIGFYDMLKNNNTEKFVIIKGGSGVGKSTLIKKVAAQLEKNGKKVEYYYCTGDVSSLDGIRSFDQKIVMLDGTAPHIVEPKQIGVTDFTVDLSKFINNEKLLSNKAKLQELTNDKASNYSLAYSYLSAAGCLNNKASGIYFQKIKNDSTNNLIKYLITLVNNNIMSQKLFSGGITADGEFYFDNLTDKSLLFFSGDKLKSGLILTKLYNILKQLNIPCRVFFSPLDDKFVYDIEFENLIITTNALLETSSNKEVIDINDYFLPTNTNVIEKLSYNSYKLVENASECLKQAKQTHLEIEKIYFPCIDFDGINTETDKIFSFLNI